MIDRTADLRNCCDAVFGNDQHARCQKTDGHEGKHRHHMVEWVDVAPLCPGTCTDGVALDDTVTQHRRAVSTDGYLPIADGFAQPTPRRNDEVPTWDLVVADIQARDQVGRQRYGTPLQPRNGRDSLRDAYEETLDTVVYLRNRMREEADIREAADRLLLVHRREDWPEAEQAYCSCCDDSAGPINWPCDAARLALLVLGR